MAIDFDLDDLPAGYGSAYTLSPERLNLYDHAVQRRTACPVANRQAALERYHANMAIPALREAERERQREQNRRRRADPEFRERECERQRIIRAARKAGK